MYPAYFGIVHLTFRLVACNWADPDDIVKNFDELLYITIKKFYRERCRGDSAHFKSFLLGPQKNTDRHSIINKNILGQDAYLLHRFSSDMLEKLPLLWIAVLSGHRQSAELLVSSGADVGEVFGFRDIEGIDAKWSILHLLLQVVPDPKNDSLIRLVVEKATNLKAQDSWGRTALHIAVARGLVQLTEQLLLKGADANIADCNGVTPLLEAASSSKVGELLPLLIKYGANILAKDNLGQNPLHRLSAAPADQLDLVARVLIEKGVFLDEEEQGTKFRPLHRAVSRGRSELVAFYLICGADVDARAYNGTTPLHLAARNISRPKTLATLLSNGANLLLKDADGKTPFGVMELTGGVKKTSIRLMLRALALTRVTQPSIDLAAEERIIEGHPELRNYYRDCIEQLETTKTSRIVETCTIFELIAAKCYCRFRELMRDPEFEKKVKFHNMYGFATYAEEILRAFDRAKKQYTDGPERCYQLRCS